MVVRRVKQPNDRRRPVRSDIELDDTDLTLLRLLVSNARMPNNALAAAVGIAPSTCLMRIRRLEGAGVIQAYTVDLAPEALGRPLQAIVSVRLQAHARANIGAFTERFSGLPGVLNVFFLAGANDFQIHVASASPNALRDFVVENLSASRDVAATETNLIFEHVATSALT